MNLQNSLIVIPARGGSVGIKNKNLQLVHGLTLVQRTFEHAKFMSNGKIPICISTDSTEILESLNAKFDLGVDINSLLVNSLSNCDSIYVHFRSVEKASSSTLITENLFDIFSLLRNQGFSINGIVLMQPTSPFRSKSELVEIREILAVAKDEDISLVSMTKVEDSHPARMYRLTRRSRAKRLRGFRNDYHKRRQDLPPVYIRDGGIYFIGAKLVRDKLQYSKKPTVYSRQFPWSLNIDSEIDLLVAQSVPREQVAQDPAS